MNRIDAPVFDDHAALLELSLNHRLGSHPLLQNYVVPIGDAYVDYVTKEGDASVVAGTILDAALVAPFNAHYASPPNCLPHIAEIRKAWRSRTCPMCGSPLGGTLDHVLPKAAFPCFAIFAKNLVPACDCNSHRINEVVGPNGARILHPYFDDILRERLISARFDDVGAVPRVGIRFVIDPAHALYTSVVFHFDKVVSRTAIVEWIGEEWGKFVLEPGGHIADLRRSNPSTRDELVASIEVERGIRDRSLRSLNNWQSVFVNGLLDDHVIDWIFAALTAPGRVVGGPLMPGVR